MNTFNGNPNKIISIDPPKEKITILAFGDMMLGRYVEILMQKNGRNYPFEKISNFIKKQKTDIVFANLEGPIIKNFVKTNSGITFSFNPLVVLNLKDTGFNLLSLANNHTLNMNGLAQTKSILNKAKINYIGHPNLINENSVFQTSINNQQIIVIAANASFSSFNQNQLLNLISEYRQENSFIIVSLHWGNEYQNINSAIQQKLARELIDNGANLIIGHHPHVVQNIEKYKNGLIFYSLGNFIFDQYWSEETQKGLAFLAELGESQTTYQLFPITLLKSQPKVTSGAEKETRLTNLAESNPQSKLSEEIKSGTITVNRIFLK